MCHVRLSPRHFSKALCEPTRFLPLSLSPQSALAVGKRLSSNHQKPSRPIWHHYIISTTLAPLHAVQIPWHCSQWASSKCPAFPSRLRSKNARAKYELPVPLNFQPGHPFSACSNISRKHPPVEWISLGVSFGVWGAEVDFSTEKSPERWLKMWGGGRLPKWSCSGKKTKRLMGESQFYHLHPPKFNSPPPENWCLEN